MEKTTAGSDPLRGIRVLLIAQYVPGPLAASLLRSMGAEVIKVEPPNHDKLRGFAPFLKSKTGRMSAWFRCMNAGFKSIVVDFRHAEGPSLLGRLIAESDVLIDGNRPGYLGAILGYLPETVNKRLVYVPISAYGQVGPLRQMAGHDNNVLALAGNLSYTPSNGEGLPSVFSAPVADMFAGQMAALAALAALMGRERQVAFPQVVDASMLHSAFFFNQMQVAALNADGTLPAPEKSWMNGGMANYRCYKTADDKAVFFGPLEPELFSRFANAVGQPDLVGLAYSDNEALQRRLELIFAGKRLAEWEDELQGLDVCVSAVNDLRQAMEHPQINSLRLVQDVEDPRYGALKLAGLPFGFGGESLQPEAPSAAPEPGEHTAGILSEVLGLDAGAVELMFASGVVA